jgi:hypothetical protein
MAIRSVIGIATAIAFFSFLGTPVASAQECYTRDAFFKAVKDPDTVIMLSKAEATKKIVSKINENRVRNGLHPVDGRSLAIGILKDSQGATKVGVAIFDASDCVIPETVIVLPFEHWVAFAQEAGVSAEDFSILQDS